MTHKCMSIKSIRESKWLTIEQKNIATRELNDKLRLEKMLDAQLRPIMNRMNRDFKRKYAATGSIIDFDIYRGDIAATLRKHYDRVQKTFKTSTKQVTNQELADLGLAEWQADKLVTQPEFIINTTQKDANKSVREAMNSMLGDGVALTALGVASVASVFNRRKLFGRLTGITITETQTAAESTKLIEAQALSGRTPYTVRNDPFALTRPREEDVKDGSKQWITVGDRNVRASHTSADRQTVDIDAPFEVGGYKMRHPADTSLGAPVKEWVNCRCASNIKIDF
mgnify:FL=1